MGRSAEEIKKDIESGNTALGIEFGSTRIKAVLTDGTTAPIAQGSYEWENRLENGIWTYSLEDIWKGLKDCYADLAADVKKQYGLTLKKVGAMGVSAMMHGYMAFDADLAGLGDGFGCKVLGVLHIPHSFLGRAGREQASQDHPYDRVAERLLHDEMVDTVRRQRYGKKQRAIAD